MLFQDIGLVKRVVLIHLVSAREEYMILGTDSINMREHVLQLFRKTTDKCKGMSVCVSMCRSRCTSTMQQDDKDVSRSFYL